MLSVDSLKAYGANTEEGLGRCMNMEAFYLKLVGQCLADAKFDELKAAIAEKDNKRAFEAAHALKGSLGNLALTPMYKPVCELTELLRGAEGPVDGDALLEELLAQLEKARAL